MTCHKNGNCPMCGKHHKDYDSAWKCGVEAGTLLALCRLQYDLVPDEVYRKAYQNVVDMAPYLEGLPGYPMDD
jgi:hypothetical protein